MEFKPSKSAMLKSFLLYLFIDLLALGILLYFNDGSAFLRLFGFLALAIGVPLTIHFPLFYAFYRVEVKDDGIRFRSPYPVRRVWHSYNLFLPWSHVNEMLAGYNREFGIREVQLVTSTERLHIPLTYIDQADKLEELLRNRMVREAAGRRPMLAA